MHKMPQKWVLRHKREYEWEKEKTKLLQEIANLKRERHNADLDVK